jgi:phage tail-like protein
MPAPAVRNDPYLNFNFQVEMEGGGVAGFSEVELPEGRIEVIAHRTGSDASNARMLPGRVEYDPLVLRRGFTADTTLYDWWHETTQGNVIRRDVLVVLLNERREEVARWRVMQAWPSKYATSDLQGLGSEVLIETLELTHEGVQLIT